MFSANKMLPCLPLTTQRPAAPYRFDLYRAASEELLRRGREGGGARGFIDSQRNVNITQSVSMILWAFAKEDYVNDQARERRVGRRRSGASRMRRRSPGFSSLSCGPPVRAGQAGGVNTPGQSFGSEGLRPVVGFVVSTPAVSPGLAWVGAGIRRAQMPSPPHTSPFLSLPL